jgi:hypothetical protein
LSAKIGRLSDLEAIPIDGSAKDACLTERNKEIENRRGDVMNAR